MSWVEVAPALPVQGTFTYSASDRVGPGHVVLVPWGPRKVTGYVVGLPSEPGMDAKRIRPIDRLLDPQPAFDARQLAFFRWMAAYYRSPLGEVIATALPSAMKAATRTVFRASDEGVEALATGDSLDDEEAEVLRELISRPGLTRRSVTLRLRELLETDASARALDRLSRKGLVDAEQEERGGTRSLHKVVHRLADGPTKGRRQQEVLDAVEGSIALAQLVALQGPYARTAVKALVKTGVLNVTEEERRDPVVQGELPADSEPPPLTRPQQLAVDGLLGPARPWLLHGVTGSGKTEVYLHAAQGILDRGLQVLVLVPEIGLTPLLTGRFRARFGDAIAVLHSGLTPAQRLREWRRIRAGEARVAVGARSALFAPFQDLGLIVVDEEHDDSYKQDDGVRYHARDLAVVRAHMAGCSVVLGSATPSLESWHNAQTGAYGLLQLLERPTPRPVPVIELVDMNAEPKVDGRPPLVAEPVREALTACFARGDQAIVLYNRRGYATLIQCGDCGGAFECPSCGVGLVLHQSQRTLSCHYCGFHREQPSGCPACGGALDILGRGTEKIEEHLRTLFPDIPIERMDADTTAAKGAHFTILERFRKGETRLLVGTQIVAKGHDFPDVSCAVVLGADHILRMPDFRSAERCHSLVTQLAGRAGRGQQAGQVLVQSHQGGHYAFKLLGDFDAFAREELRHRDLLLYPPFSRLALMRIEGPIRQHAMDAAWALRKRLRGLADGQRIQVLGPAMAALPKLVGRYRVQLVLRGTDKHEFRRWLADADLSLPKGTKGVRVAVDVDPRHLM